MYTAFLFIHSWLRWIILLLFIAVFVKSFIGMSGGREYQKGDNAMAAGLVGVLHLQLLLGLVLYFALSPLTSSAFASGSGMMKETSLRFWAVEHVFATVAGVAVAQIGRIKAKKKGSSAAKFRTQAIFFGIALILILLRIPWGEAERLFR